MRFASSVTATADSVTALDELLGPLEGRITPGAVELALLFVSPHFEDELEAILVELAERLPAALLIGCTADGTIGNDRELERTPSIAMLGGILPDVGLHPFHVRQRDVATCQTVYDWERVVGVSPDSKPVFLAFADPFQLDVTTLVEQLNTHYPGAPLIGGIASAGHRPGENRLVIGGEVVREGMVGVALSGQLQVDTVVSQGCRPIGEPFIITRGEQNVVFELGGHPALRRLRDVLSGLSEDEAILARQALFMGRAIDEQRERFSRGDFLIQNIIGVDRGSGAIGIAGHARVGATVQFHVRDAATADEDLRTLLERHRGRSVSAALLFGCNGRGTHMWPVAGHDVGVLREVFPGVPVAGFFCGGEFGPVGGRNFIHGYTASIGLLREPAPSSEPVQ